MGFPDFRNFQILFYFELMPKTLNCTGSKLC